jgi:hypothetical protein
MRTRVVVLVGCVLLAGCTGSPATARHPQARPRASGSVTSIAAAPVSRRIGPWDATTVGGHAHAATPVAGTRSSLYAVLDRRVLRIDAASGRILAQHSVPSGGRAAVVADVLWLATGRHGLRGYALDTLAPAATLPVRGSALAANARTGRIFVGAARTVSVVDATKQRVVRSYHVPWRIAALAINPAGTRLYIASNVPSTMFSRIAVLDPTDGGAITQPVRFDGGSGYDGVAASSGGIWLENGSGMTNWLAFHPAAELADRPWPVITNAGGGFPVTATVARDVVWVGGTTRLACADPVTGRVRASVRVPTPGGDAANISGLVPVGKTLFAFYIADGPGSQALIRLTPPARCFG